MGQQQNCENGSAAVFCIPYIDRYFQKAYNVTSIKGNRSVRLRLQYFYRGNEVNEINEILRISQKISFSRHIYYFCSVYLL